MIGNPLSSIPNSLLVVYISSLLALFVTHLILSNKKNKKKSLLSPDGNNGKHPANNKVPPMAPTGTSETIKSLSSTDSPWFLLDTARELKSYVFRLDIAKILGCPMYFIVGEQKLAHKIFMDPLTTKPEHLYNAVNALSGNVPKMFTRNGEFWHARRKGVAPAFSSKHVKRMNRVASEKVEEWIETKLNSSIENDESFDVGKEMIDITLSTISEAGLEYDMSDEEKKMFLTELELGLKEFGFKTSLNPMRKYFGLFFKERRRAYVAARRLQSFNFDIINAYRKLENPTKDTIIDRIMNNKAYKNDAERGADIASFLTAGHDTTAYTIAWILKELAKNPKEQQKLRDSLLLIQRDDWGQSETLRNIVMEGMRLHPAAALGSARHIGRDIRSDDGFVLPKGSIVTIPIILATRNENVFKNADSFIPSRWDEATKEMYCSLFPFAAGKQNCVGQSLAKVEIYSLIPQICSKFELELENEGSTEFFLTLKPVKTMMKAKKLG
jgi:cytochrome P450